MTFADILNNNNIMMWVMAAIVFLVTQLIKQPIKLLTKKLSEKARKAINSVILLLPFGFGILIHFLYTNYIVHTDLNIVQGVIVGGQSIALYGIVERFFGLKITNPYKTTEGAEIVAQVQEIVQDGTIDTTELKSLLTTMATQMASTTTTDDATTDETTVETDEDKLKKLLDSII